MLIIVINSIYSFVLIKCSKHCYVTLVIQFNIIHLFAHIRMVEQFYLTHWPIRYYRDPGVMSVKGYSTFPKASALSDGFSVRSRILVGGGLISLHSRCNLQSQSTGLDLVWFSFIACQPLFNTKSIFIHINSSISNNSVKHTYSFFVYTQLNIKTVLFQTIQFSTSTQFSSIRPLNRTLPGATTPRQRGPGSDDNKRVLCIPQSFSVTEALPFDCLVSYPGLSLWGESYFSAKMQSVYSEAPSLLGHLLGSLTPLQRCSRCILRPQPTGLYIFRVEVVLRNAWKNR